MNKNIEAVLTLLCAALDTETFEETGRAVINRELLIKKSSRSSDSRCKMGDENIIERIFK